MRILVALTFTFAACAHERVKLCELLTYPARWAGVTVEVHGELTFGSEDGPYLEGRDCRTQARRVELKRSGDSNWDEFWQAMNDASARYDPHRELVAATVVGLFKITDPESLYGPASLRVKTMSVTIVRRHRPLEPGWERVVDYWLSIRGRVMWKQVAEALRGPDGAQYFRKSFQNVLFPGGALAVQFVRAKIVAVNDLASPPSVDLQIFPGSGGEVRLRLVNSRRPLVASLKPGDEVAFRGVVASYSVNPFQVTLNAKRGDFRRGSSAKLW